MTNANLIAAAPDMRDALKDALTLFNQIPRFLDVPSGIDSYKLASRIQKIMREVEGKL